MELKVRALKVTVIILLFVLNPKNGIERTLL